MTGNRDTQESVKQYYGKILQGSKDLKTGACCSQESFSPEHREILKEIDDEILERFYGCGSPIPPAIEGCKILDLGCGTGRDVYLAAKLVGPAGSVIGIDMTEEQLAVARRHLSGQMERFSFSAPNVDFRHGYIEDLAACDIADDSVDLIISNCVLNLSPNKERAFSEIFRVLKPGGELYFSDVFTDRRLSEPLQNDPLLYGECLGGALYIEDFRRLLQGLGCKDYRVMSQRPIAIDNPEIAEKTGLVNFSSITVRAFKLDGLEDICEDYGQTATYLGSIPDSPHAFSLDDHHLFVTGKPMLVCGNTAAMVQDTRFGRHFSVTGDCSVHFGPFPCGPTSANNSAGGFDAGDACC